MGKKRFEVSDEIYAFFETLPPKRVRLTLGLES